MERDARGRGHALHVRARGYSGQGKTRPQLAARRDARVASTVTQHDARDDETIRLGQPHLRGRWRRPSCSSRAGPAAGGFFVVGARGGAGFLAPPGLPTGWRLQPLLAAPAALHRSPPGLIASCFHHGGTAGLLLPCLGKDRSISARSLRLPYGSSGDTGPAPPARHSELHDPFLSELGLCSRRKVLLLPSS